MANVNMRALVVCVGLFPLAWYSGSRIYQERGLPDQTVNRQRQGHWPTDEERKVETMVIERNEKVCTLCMLCVRDCVAGVWRLVEGRPTPVEPSFCNGCSHCIAVCPADAIRHTGLDAGQAVKVNRANLNPEVFREIVLSRRSIRHYKDKPVPAEILERIIDLAHYAPTASNDQNVGYVVVTDKALIQTVAKQIFGYALKLNEKSKQGLAKRIIQAAGLSNLRYLRLMDTLKEEYLAGRDFILHNAPVLILLHGPRLKPFAGENCSIAATTIVNYAHSLGLGSCFTGLLTLAVQFNPAIRKQLGVPRGRRVYTSLVLGYPAYAFSRTVSRKPAQIVWKS